MRCFYILAILLSTTYPGYTEDFSLRWRRIMARDPGAGIASWYSDRQTSSGEHLRPNDRADLTCASPTEPIGTVLRVTYRGRSIVCRVTDYGPAPRLRRLIDLTPAGFEMLGLRKVNGLAQVTVERE